MASWPIQTKFFSMCQEKKILPLQSERQLRLLETFVTEKMNGTPSVADRHRFAADLDPNFHFDSDPDPDWHHNDVDSHANHTQIFTHVGKQSQRKFTFFTAMSVYNVFLSHKWQRCRSCC
jgi:hypothetical protein